MPKIDKEKAARLIAKGDKLKAKGKFRRALKRYRRAKEYDPERTDIYDRLVEAHDHATKEWSEKDVAESVGWVMKKQELENPAIKLLHERLTPEWKEVTEKITALIMCSSEGEEQRLIGEIRAFGADAVYPLVYTLLQIKKGASDASDGATPGTDVSDGATNVSDGAKGSSENASDGAKGSSDITMQKEKGK